MKVNLGGYEFQCHTNRESLHCLTNGVATAGGTSLKELTIFLESSLLLEKPNLIVQKCCTSCEL